MSYRPVVPENPSSPSKSVVEQLIEKMSACVSPSVKSAPRSLKPLIYQQLSNGVIIEVNPNDPKQTPRVHSCIPPGGRTPEGVIPPQNQNDNPFMRFVEQIVAEKKVLPVLLPNDQKVNAYDLSTEPSALKNLLGGIVTTQEQAIPIQGGTVYIDILLLNAAPFEQRKYKVSTKDPLCGFSTFSGNNNAAGSAPASPPKSPTRAQPDATWQASSARKAEDYMNKAAHSIDDWLNKMTGPVPVKTRHPSEMVKEQYAKSQYTPSNSPPHAHTQTTHTVPVYQTQHQATPDHLHHLQCTCHLGQTQGSTMVYHVQPQQLMAPVVIPTYTAPAVVINPPVENQQPAVVVPEEKKLPMFSA